MVMALDVRASMSFCVCIVGGCATLLRALLSLRSLTNRLICLRPAREIGGLYLVWCMVIVGGLRIGRMLMASEWKPSITVMMEAASVSKCVVVSCCCAWRCCSCFLDVWMLYTGHHRHLASLWLPSFAEIKSSAVFADANKTASDGN